MLWLRRHAAPEARRDGSPLACADACARRCETCGLVCTDPLAQTCPRCAAELPWLNVCANCPLRGRCG